MARRKTRKDLRQDLIAYRNHVKDGASYDEMFGADGVPRKEAVEIYDHMVSPEATPAVELQEGIDATIEALGITFAVTGSDEGIDRPWPLDIIPRVISKTDWDRTEAGLKQRQMVLNMFIDDCYGQQRAIKEGIVPKETVFGSPNYIKKCEGARPRHGVWANICGTDLLRKPDGVMVSLEDNLRVPSGISYMLENREVMYRVAVELFERCKILPVERFPSQLYQMLAAMTPRPGSKPNIVVHTPGIYNSAYFEHAHLASKMGVPLVEAADMVVIDDVVYLRTIGGLKQVDVIYRRVSDMFIDPRALNKESVLGVPGLFRAWRLGNVSLANSPGTGIADDKAVYAYVPKLTRFYLDEDPLLPILDTLHMSDKESRDKAFGEYQSYVFKPTVEAGGKGIVIGAKSSKAKIERLKRQVLANPSHFIAQDVCQFSTAPTLTRGSIRPCHVDLRPFVTQAEQIEVTAGGLTRVAARHGEMIVNSSQGGRSKDTWIVDLSKRGAGN